MSKRSTKSVPVKWILITAATTALLTAGVMMLVFGFHRPPAGMGPEGERGAGTETAKKQLWTCGMHPWIISEEPGLCPICNMELTPKRDTAGDDTPAAKGGERQIAYWRAPMDPMEIYDEPGKSKMGMDLVPVYEDELIGGVEIRIDPVVEQNMGVRTATVEKGPLVYTIRTYGHITYDETRTALVSPKVNGWIETLHVDFTGEQVQAGDPLFDIYSPELLAAQEEYLTTFRSLQRMGRGSSDLLNSARRRLSYFDVAEPEIRAIEAEETVKKAVTIRSPFSGVVIQRDAVEGGFVKTGTRVYTIADLSRVWLEAHIYEYELDRVKLGQEAEMRLPYRPGRVFHGKVSYIYPYLQKKTRDVRVRLSFENPDLILKPDMYADVRIQTRTEGEGVIIPSESVIRSGERNVVFVARGEGRFTPREVVLGTPVDGQRVQVLSGLAPGETIVTSGQFLLDSESKLKEAVQKMMEVKSAPAEPKKAAGQTKGAADADDFFNDMDGDKAGATSEDDFFKDMTK